LKADPTLALRMNEIEAFTKSNAKWSFVNGRVEIPVVVNVLYNTAAENISLTQIQSQIDVLNADFNATIQISTLQLYSLSCCKRNHICFRNSKQKIYYLKSSWELEMQKNKTRRFRSYISYN
jgi:hypothetical protein